MAVNCSHERRIRMLARRAAYVNPSKRIGLYEKEGRKKYMSLPFRSRPKVVDVWIHPHEISDTEYFWGGYMSLLVEKDGWVLSRPGSKKSSAFRVIKNEN